MSCIVEKILYNIKERNWSRIGWFSTIDTILPLLFLRVFALEFICVKNAIVSSLFSYQKTSFRNKRCNFNVGKIRRTDKNV